MTTAFLVVAAFLTAIISGVVGMAGGVTLLAAMTFVLPVQVIIPIHGAVQLVSNISRTLMLRYHIERRILLSFCLGTPLGALAAYGFLSHFAMDQWALLLVVVMLLYVALKPDRMPDIDLGLRGFFVLGLVAAFLGPLLGATGPLLAPFFASKSRPKEQIVATKAACQIFIHIYKIPIFLGLDFAFQDYFDVMALMVLGVVAGTKVGTMLLHKLSPERFRILLRLALFVTALRLIYKLSL